MPPSDGLGDPHPAATATTYVQVRVRLPAALADLADGRREVVVRASVATVGGVLGALATDVPTVALRIRDETGAIRRFVNVYVDGNDIRHLDGLATLTPDGSTVHILPSVAGG
jgi:sulfur-carrier protein